MVEVEVSVELSTDPNFSSPAYLILPVGLLERHRESLPVLCTVAVELGPREHSFSLLEASRGCAVLILLPFCLYWYATQCFYFFYFDGAS